MLFAIESCGGERKWVEGIRPDPNSERYTAIFRYDSLGEYDSVSESYHGLVASKAARIDSNGLLATLQQLDSVSYHSNIDPHILDLNLMRDSSVNEKRKILTDLFPKYYFSAVMTLFSGDCILLRGMTTSECREVEHWRMRQDRKLQGRGCNLWGPIEGYWMVANIKTGKISEVGYEDHSPILSSSGRHILFYKQDGDDYRMKVVSVKEIIEGM